MKIFLLITSLLINAEPLKINLLKSVYYSFKGGEEATFALSIPPLKEDFVLLVSGNFHPGMEVYLETDKGVISSKLEGEGVIKYAIFPLQDIGNSPVLRIKNNSPESVDLKFYVDSSEIRIKEVPLEDGYFVTGFRHLENKPLTVGCVFPFRSKSNTWVKSMKNLKIEDALYTSFSAGENVAFRRMEIKEGAGHYFVFSELHNGKGFVNCEAEEMKIVKKSPIGKGIIIVSIIVALILAGSIIYFAIYRKK
jgi:hypothetical protein